jgi:hypothetical protein
VKLNNVNEDDDYGQDEFENTPANDKDEEQRPAMAMPKQNSQEKQQR